MASGYGVPVRFTKEKNVWDLFALVNIGSGGAVNFAQVPSSGGPQLVSKGVANVWQNTPTFTGTVASGSSTITSVSSFLGIYSGMTITGANITNSLTIGTITAATGSLVLSGPATGGNATFIASGGQYIFQFGVATTIGSLTQSSRLDTYNRCLDFNLSYDGSTASSIGTQTQAQLSPNTSQYVVVQNNTTIKTVPQTLTSASTDASLIVQFGNSIGTSFVPAVPTAGLLMRIGFTFGNTTSP